MNLEILCKELRRIIFSTAYKGKSGHLASALSLVEILAVLYFANILQYDKSNDKWEKRDKLILSKGHASLALYSVLYKIGYISKAELDQFCQPGSLLGGEPKLGDINGVEATTGSLGHGLSFGAGIAMANKLDHKNAKVYVIIGDGECQEGSIWEAAMSIGHHKLENVIVIMDDNKLQAMDETDEILTIEPLKSKWESFGFEVFEADGHNLKQLEHVFNEVLKSRVQKPKIIVAHTIKGKGISFMENVPIWHYRMPNKEELKTVLEELDLTMNELA